MAWQLTSDGTHSLRQLWVGVRAVVVSEAAEFWGAAAAAATKSARMVAFIVNKLGEVLNDTTVLKICGAVDARMLMKEGEKRRAKRATFKQ